MMAELSVPAQWIRPAGRRIAGGGVLYSGAGAELTAFAEAHGLPVAFTQAGKSAMDENHPLALGSVGVTGTSASNAMAADATGLLDQATDEIDGGIAAAGGLPARQTFQRIEYRHRIAPFASVNVPARAAPTPLLRRAAMGESVQ